MYSEKIRMLIEQYNTTEDIKKKASTGVLLNNEFLFICQYDEALKYGFEAWKIAEEIGYNALFYDCLASIGLTYFNQCKYAKALEYFEKCLENHFKNPQKSYLAQIYINMGACYHNMDNYYKAVEYYLKGNDALKGKNDDNAFEGLCFNLGEIYTETGDYDKADEWLTKATKVENSQLGYMAYYFLGNLHKKKKNHLLSIRYFKKSLELLKDKDYFDYLFGCCNYLALLYIEIGKTNEAIEFGNRSVEYAEKSTVVLNILEADLAMATVYMNIKDTRKAKEYFKKCLALEKEETNEQFSLRLYETYSAFCFETKNVKEGHEYRKKALCLKAKIEKAEREKKIEFLSK